MAEIIKMPRLSDTMEEGTVSTWLKKVGDSISEGDILAEIQTDKATMEFESFYSGTLLHIGLKEGETAPVDSLLAIIGKKGEDISAFIDNKTTPESPKKSSVSKVAEPTISKDSTVPPEGVCVVKMPRLSDTMEEGTVSTWLKEVGDSISEGDILAEIQTDKATMEFESFYSGTLLHIGLKEGETAPVDSLLAIIGKKGTDISGLITATPISETKSSPKESEAKKQPEITTPQNKPSTPLVADNSRVFISPLAKKIALEKGINISQIKGSGDNGRITKSDVENFEQQADVANSRQINLEVLYKESVEEVVNSPMRKTIAKRLAESKFTAPHYYLSIDVDMDKASKFRAEANTFTDTKISFNDIVVKACACALKKHLQVNSSWKDTVTQINHHINIGVAIAVEDGLVVPVLKFADAMSLTQIGTKVKEFAAKARDKKLAPNDMEGSTFTISNLGMFGVVEFTSIINQPNSAILSVGAIAEQPVVRNGVIVVGSMMRLTLACDHRTIDGATGAQFLKTLKDYIETPISILF